jgi:hypothetical protein
MALPWYFSLVLGTLGLPAREPLWSLVRLVIRFFVAYVKQQCASEGEN